MVNFALKVYRKFQKCSFKENKIRLIFLNVSKIKLIPKFLRFKLWKQHKDKKAYSEFKKKLEIEIKREKNKNE